MQRILTGLFALLITCSTTIARTSTESPSHQALGLTRSFDLIAEAERENLILVLQGRGNTRFVFLPERSRSFDLPAWTRWDHISGTDYSYRIMQSSLGQMRLSAERFSVLTAVFVELRDFEVTTWQDSILNGLESKQIQAQVNLEDLFGSPIHGPSYPIKKRTIVEIHPGRSNQIKDLVISSIFVGMFLNQIGFYAFVWNPALSGYAFVSPSLANVIITPATTILSALTLSQLPDSSRIIRWIQKQDSLRREFILRTAIVASAGICGAIVSAISLIR